MERGDDDLPRHLRHRPTNRCEWDFPTAWLLGTRLLASLLDIGISAIFSFDPRDWMHAGEPLDLTDKSRCVDGAFWFDFVADSGDSARLVYQLAYLLQQPTLEVRAEKDGLLYPLSERLPRGVALVFGGDTAYPIATRRRLLERIRAPFIWAKHDLAKHAHVEQAHGAAHTPSDVYLLGIPGNHDYYNALAGFERQFHDRGRNIDPSITDRVDLPGYTLEQRSSYFAARLPFGWQLWGLDDEMRPIDALQSEYFQKAAARKDFGRKLIIATSRPTTVNHAPSPNRAALADGFAVVGLGEQAQQPFEREGILDDRWLRLDLSGDTHLYERYWGKDADPALAKDPIKAPQFEHRRFPPTDRWSENPRPNAVPLGNETTAHTATPMRDNYASVVTGLGGAFHHPSQVREWVSAGKARAPRRAWPGGGASDRAIGERLIRPRKVFQAGAVGVIGIGIAFMTYGTGRENVLDVPFELLHCSPGLQVALLHLASIASLLGTIAVLVALTILAIRLGRRLHRQIQDMTGPHGWWGRFTHCISHNKLGFWCLRWLGVNRRNAWGVLITLPVSAVAIAAWVVGLWALYWCPYMACARDGFTPTYVTLVLLVFFLAGLCATKMYQRHQLAGVLPGIALGALTAIAIVWTPYAWTRFAVSSHRLCALLFFGYIGIRHLFLREWILAVRTPLRRVLTLLAYFAIVALYIIVPAVLAGDRTHDMGWWGRPLATVLGGYLACLWMGWYFFICLQWNVHGNEAGGAARVVSFAEFLRIKLTEDRAEVWVIGAEGPTSTERSLLHPCSKHVAEAPPVARLIDHFVVERKGAP